MSNYLKSLNALNSGNVEYALRLLVNEIMLQDADDKTFALKEIQAELNVALVDITSLLNDNLNKKVSYQDLETVATKQDVAGVRQCIELEKTSSMASDVQNREAIVALADKVGKLLDAVKALADKLDAETVLGLDKDHGSTVRNSLK